MIDVLFDLMSSGAAARATVTGAAVIVLTAIPSGSASAVTEQELRLLPDRVTLLSNAGAAPTTSQHAPRPASLLMMEQRLADLNALESMQDGWDEDGAPAPSPAAIASARTFVSAASASIAHMYDVDADVLGGVALLFARRDSTGVRRRAWISLRNGGQVTMVTQAGGEETIRAQAIDPANLKDGAGLLAKFLA